MYLSIVHELVPTVILYYDMFRLNSYDCLSTGREVGMLQVVQQSETVANIQKKYATLNLAAAFSKDSLFRWLQEMNPDPASYVLYVSGILIGCIYTWMLCIWNPGWSLYYLNL